MDLSFICEPILTMVLLCTQTTQLLIQPGREWLHEFHHYSEKIQYYYGIAYLMKQDGGPYFTGLDIQVLCDVITDCKDILLNRWTTSFYKYYG